METNKNLQDPELAMDAVNNLFIKVAELRTEADRLYNGKIKNAGPKTRKRALEMINELKVLRTEITNYTKNSLSTSN